MDMNRTQAAPLSWHQVHPLQQALEARVVAEGVVPLLMFGGSHHLIKNPQQVFAHDFGHILTRVPSLQ